MKSGLTGVRTILDTKSEIIAIQNYGGMKDGADRLFYEYALKHSLNIKSVYTIKMPENFTLVMFPPEFLKKRILRKAEKRIEDIANKIANRQYSLPRKKYERKDIFKK